MRLTGYNKMLVSFDLKGSQFGRKAISNIELEMIQTSHATHTSALRSENQKEEQIGIPKSLKKFLETLSEPLRDLDFLELSHKYSSVFSLNISDESRKQLYSII